MKDVPKVDRPREKLEAKGVKALSDAELLQIVVGSGVPGSLVADIAEAILEKLESGTDAITLDALLEIKGVGSASASRILASLEIANRFVREDVTRIQKAKDVLPLLSDIRNKKREYLQAISLDGAGRVISQRTISVGTLDASLVHPREVFADAVTDRASSIILAHNHPSGDTTPSQEDKEITKKLKKAGEILGISLVDHVIVSESEWESVT
ncbi:MAG: DNA repair protein RadC [Candidatus Paceibacterota bacterium]